MKKYNYPIKDFYNMISTKNYKKDKKMMNKWKLQ